MRPEELGRLQTLLGQVDLKQIRVSRGIGLAEMGDTMGCTHQNVCKIESDNNPKLGTLKNYLRALDDVLRLV